MCQNREEKIKIKIVIARIKNILKMKTKLIIGQIQMIYVKLFPIFQRNHSQVSVKNLRCQTINIQQVKDAKKNYFSLLARHFFISFDSHKVNRPMKNTLIKKRRDIWRKRLIQMTQIYSMKKTRTVIKKIYIYLNSLVQHTQWEMEKCLRPLITPLC